MGVTGGGGGYVLSHANHAVILRSVGSAKRRENPAPNTRQFLQRDSYVASLLRMTRGVRGCEGIGSRVRGKGGTNGRGNHTPILTFPH